MARTTKAKTKAPSKGATLSSVTARLFSTDNGAYGSITIDGAFAVNVTVVEGKNGAFVSFPSYRNKKGEYKDMAFPISKECREQIEEAVMEVYDTLSEDDSEE